MGLAASQARLISLQARMSDTEYEGQQINQQRQVLANKMNDVYNKALAVEVPTPPSKIDYAYNNAFKTSNVLDKDNIYFQQDDSGNFIAYQKTKAAGQFKPSSFTFNPSLFESAGRPVDNWVLDYTLQADVEIDDSNRDKYKGANGNNISTVPRLTVIVQGQWGTIELGTYLYPQSDGTYINEKGETKTIPSDYDINKLEKKTVIPKGTQVYKNEPKQGEPTRVPGMYKGTYSDVLKQLQEDNGDGSKSELIGTLTNLATKKDSIENLGVIIMGNDIRFCKSADLAAAKEGTKIDTEYYDETTEDKIILGTAIIKETTAKGVIKSFDLNGKEYKVIADGEAYDNTAYEEAMCEYENAKIEYDHQQNEFNKQTSIYQREDKQLELKLTRLDNERNALNTEIDAVKKVIQDATEKGFKTFSG